MARKLPNDRFQIECATSDERQETEEVCFIMPICIVCWMLLCPATHCHADGHADCVVLTANHVFVCVCVVFVCVLYEFWRESRIFRTNNRFFFRSYGKYLLIAAYLAISFSKSLP